MKILHMKQSLFGPIVSPTAVQVERGDVFYIRHVASEGHEITKQRPAVVVSNNITNKNSFVITVAYITSRPKADIPIHADIDTGLVHGTVLCEQIACVDKTRLVNYVGHLPPDQMARVDNALQAALGFVPALNPAVTDRSIASITTFAVEDEEPIAAIS